MGGAVSAGEDNDNLVDNLVNSNYIRSEKLIDIFRAVDRGHFYMKGQRNSAYHDVAWKFNHIHLSAPCIYSEVMEHLDLMPGMSFLNLGSGTGYLSTMAGLILGANGINHGIEIHADVVEYAHGKIKEFVAKAPVFDRFEFCEPQFTIGNCLQLPPDVPSYDRVYCGAACPPEYANYLMNLLNIGGKLVLPLEDQLQIKTRNGEQEWDSKSVLAVSFAYLITPTNENNSSKITNIPPRTVMSLQKLCRFCIRREIRKQFNVEMPPKRKKKKRERHQSLSVEDQIINRRKIARRRNRRRLNTTGGGTSRNLRRRRNTTGDSDRISSDSGDSSDDEQDDSAAPEVISEVEMKEKSINGEFVETDGMSGDANTKDSSQTKSTDEPMECEPAEKMKPEGNSNHGGGEAMSNSSKTTSCFKFLRKKKSHSDKEAGDGSSTGESEGKTENPSTVEEPAAEHGSERNSAPSSSLEGVENRRLVHSLRSGRLVYALMRGLTRASRDQEGNKLNAVQLYRSSDSESEGSSDQLSEEDVEKTKDKKSDSDSDSDELFGPLPETHFTIAIRKLPLPPKLISFLLYHRL